MKRGILFCMCALFPMVAGADYLDDKIATLTQQKLDKIAELEKCQKSTKGLKIAGITTLGVSTIGIAANIGEAVALNKTEDKIDTAQKTSSDLDSQIAAAKEEARKKAEEEAKKKVDEGKEVEEEVETSEIEKCSEPKDCSVDCNGQLETLFAKTAECFAGGCVATACADGVTPKTEKKCLDENGQEFVYYECEAPEEQIDDDSAEEGSENGSTERKHHEDCSADETAKLAGAASSWWSGSMKKCVVKSCKDKWFLTMKGNSSQGDCRDKCPEHQVVDGPNGGKGCDIARNKTCNSKELESFKNSNSAKTAECDTTTGKYVIKECKSGFREEKGSSGRIEKCVANECARKDLGKKNNYSDCTRDCQVYFDQEQCEKKEPSTYMRLTDSHCICMPTESDKKNDNPWGAPALNGGVEEIKKDNTNVVNTRADILNNPQKYTNQQVPDIYPPEIQRYMEKKYNIKSKAIPTISATK